VLLLVECYYPENPRACNQDGVTIYG